MQTFIFQIFNHIWILFIWLAVLSNKLTIFNFFFSNSFESEKNVITTFWINFLFYIIWIIPSIPIIFYEIIKKFKLFGTSKLYDDNTTFNEPNLVRLNFFKLIGNRIVLNFIGIVFINRNYDFLLAINPLEFVDSILISAVKLLIGIFIAETITYWSHRMMHLPAFYKIHKKHHQYKDPVHIATFWVSGVEGILIFLIVAIPIYAVKMDFVTAFFWYVISAYHGIHQHCGYDLLFPIFQLIPFSNNASKMHHIHHRKNKFNYAIYWPFWDKLCETYYN